MAKDGWNNGENTDTHKINEVLAAVLDDKALTLAEIEDEIRKAWGGVLPRGEVRKHLEGLMKSAKNSEGGFVRREVRYTLTNLGRAEWSKYRAAVATARKAAKKSRISK